MGDSGIRTRDLRAQWFSRRAPYQLGHSADPRAVVLRVRTSPLRESVILYHNFVITILYHNFFITILYYNFVITILYHNFVITILYHNFVITILYPNFVITILYHNF